ncbi:hypothetical protein QF042_002242 [Pedobacter sp. W3I1]|uniref:hypothetical protein n=1 Tax=Pedobacter sp. W3I1 TaxID=3042291 RepID=UPI0027899B1E|nr:hypothetical protein [Pedobacter sp. W3I1]MDQ0638677.1 hypothetical protein [Pedobacter sp. W3I1]
MTKQKVGCNGFEIMTAFNIEIDHNDQAITLTIVPKDDYFKIVYLGGILGAIRKQESDWILLKAEEIELEELAPFDYKLTENSHHLSLGVAEINQISGAIENHLQ